MNEVTTQKAAPPPPIVLFKRDLQRMKDAGDFDMLPATVSYEAFRNAAVVAITDNPAILQCDLTSVFKSIRKLAAAGLVPDGREAAIVPFSGQAQAMPMVYGLIKVARNSGEISSIWAEVVMGEETFKITMVNGDRQFSHDYDPMTRTGEVKGAYAVAKLKDGTVEIEAMGFDDIEKRRKASANQRGPKATGIWEKWYAEMAKKTVIRALVKRLPMSSDDMRRVMIEDEEPVTRDITPADDGPRKTLAQRIAERAEEAPPEPIQPEPITGEIMDDGHWTDRVDLTEAFPGDDAFTEGAQAAEDTAKGLRDCPYAEGSERAVHWLGGFAGKRGAMA